MKLRLRGNSVRLRLTQAEVKALEHDLSAEGAVIFGPAGQPRLVYRVEASAVERPAVSMSVSGLETLVKITLPHPQVAVWANGSEVGIYFEEPWGLKVAIEKDFRCLNEKRDEDESDNFDHPNAASSHQHTCHADQDRASSIRFRPTGESSRLIPLRVLTFSHSFDAAANDATRPPRASTMKPTLSLFIAVLGLFAGASLRAADPAAAGADELEAKFKATMTAATLAGRWCPLKDGVLGAEKDDKYTIVSVEKVSGSSWVMNAEMRGAVLPIPVQVKWAGDTAVIIVDHLQLPGANGYGGGTAYSARLLIHDHTYAGTWSGGDHGGLMSGVIKNEGSTSAKPKP